jgi:hypothetical protein
VKTEICSLEVTDQPVQLYIEQRKYLNNGVPACGNKKQKEEARTKNIHCLNYTRDYPPPKYLQTTPPRFLYLNRTPPTVSALLPSP